MISPDQYNAFVIEWYAGRYPRQRFGQAFVNKFLTDVAPCVQTSSLFYEESLNKAKELAWQKYVDAQGACAQ
jgi:hypothetical protein